MEHLTREKTERKDEHGTGKKPYASPTLRLYGDVDKITKVLRLSRAKRGTGGSGEII